MGTRRHRHRAAFAELELALDRPTAALAAIEPELATLDGTDAAPYLRARARFAAARAMIGTHGDERRAIALATLARDDGAQEELKAEIVQWLAQHAAGP
jgi:hypothetical protein